MKKIFSILTTLCVTTMLHAVPAYRGAIHQTMENGEEIEVYLHGDEHFHWTTNAQGEWLTQNADGTYRRIEAMSEADIQAIVAERQARMPQSRMPQATQTAIDLNIAPRGLVVLVSFADKEFATDFNEMKDMLNGEHYTRSFRYKMQNITAEGSARQYFKDASFGQYEPQFDIAGPYTLSKEASYYGENDYYGNDKHADEMIIEACQLADADVDFTLYDNNGDGQIDFVYVIYASYGEADGGGSNTIWPHTAWIKDSYGRRVYLDGLMLNTYACGNEIAYDTNQHCGIGTFCHEFSHVLGLPDLYITGGSSSHKTLGAWDNMDYGPYNNYGNTPPSLSAYERFFMGWLTPIQLDATDADITIEDLKTSNSAYLITENDAEHNMVGNDPNPTVFWLLENRQKTGWDKYIPGEGMLLTKIKYAWTKWNDNKVNNQKANQGVDLIEADGSAPNGNDGKPGDAFPKGATNYDGIAGHNLNTIALQNGVITLKMNNGLPEGIEDQTPDAKIIGVYDLLGRPASQDAVGVKIIITNQGAKKQL